MLFDLKFPVLLVPGLGQWHKLTHRLTKLLKDLICLGAISVTNMVEYVFGKTVIAYFATPLCWWQNWKYRFKEKSEPNLIKTRPCWETQILDYDSFVLSKTSILGRKFLRQKITGVIISPRVDRVNTKVYFIFISALAQKQIVTCHLSWAVSIQLDCPLNLTTP